MAPSSSRAARNGDAHKPCGCPPAADGVNNARQAASDVLSGMYGLAVRYDVLSVNPIREARTVKTERMPARAASSAEFERVRAALRTYNNRKAPGPRPGRLLAAFVELMAATGARPNEVVALRWSDVDLLADPPTVTITGTLIDHGRIPGKPLHRQDACKGDAPPHTVLLPRFGVEALTALVAESGMDGPQRQTLGPDVRAVLDEYAGGDCGD